jgi:hypothetical protein
MSGEVLTLIDHCLVAACIGGGIVAAFKFPWRSLPTSRGSELQATVRELHDALAAGERAQAKRWQEADLHIESLTSRFDEQVLHHKETLQELKDEKNRWLVASQNRTSR